VLFTLEKYIKEFTHALVVVFADILIDYPIQFIEFVIHYQPNPLTSNLYVIDVAILNIVIHSAKNEPFVLGADAVIP
jgi:hypothetical protein